MKKTTVFKKNIQLKKFNIKFPLEYYRSKDDAIIAESLGYNLSKKEAPYLESFLADFNLIQEDHKARYVAVWDFETTNKFQSYAVSMAIMLYDIQEDEVVEEYYELFNPLAPISEGAYKVHKISEDEVSSEKTFAEKIEDIEAIFNKADFFVGQNLGFDLDVLEREYERMDKVNPYTTMPVFDTMKAARDIVKAMDKNGKKIKNASLKEIVEYYGLDSDKEFHNALVDVRETLNIFRELLEEEF